MPFTRKQIQTAQAVKRGMKPTGSAKGFTKGFAEQVIAESKTKGTKKGKR